MKRTFRKIMSLLLAVTLVFGTVAFGFADVDWSEIDWHDFAIKAEAAETFTEGYYTYTVDENGNATITDVKETISGSQTIPDELEGYPVTSIGEYAFSLCDNLKSVTIGNSVTSIGKRAFYSCDNLKSITVDSANTAYLSDEYGVLFNKDKIELIQYPIGNTRANYDIPDGVISIGDDAFYGCGYLSRITIPNSVTNIGDDAFYYCYRLTRIKIPDSVTKIGNQAFVGTGYYNDKSNWENNVLYIDNCLIDAESSISGSCSIKDGTKTIGFYAFADCDGLMNVIIPDSVTSIGCYAFGGCVSLTSIKIPNNVTSINMGTFCGCKSLISITFGNSVASIGNDVFNGCYSLTDVYYTGDVATWCKISYGEYDSMPMNPAKNLYIEGVKIEGDFIIPNNVTSIGDLAFICCDNITSVTIPDSVTSIGFSSFKYCTHLANVTIGNSVSSIGEGAFNGCIGLTGITVDSENTAYSSDEYGVLFNKDKTEIIQYPIGNTRTSYVIPDSVTSIAVGAFESSDTLTDVYFDGTEDEWHKVTISNYNKALTDAKIHFKFSNADEPETELTTNSIATETTTKPVVTVPSTTKPVEIPVTTKPVTTKPAEEPSTTKPNVENTTDSVVTKPSTEPTEPVETPITKPSTTKPVTTKPVEVPTMTKPVVTELSTTKPVEVSTTTKPITTELSTTKPVKVPITTKPVETEPSTVPATQPSAEQKKLFEIRKPSQTEITYGDSIILHADFEGKIPEDTKVIWATDNANFTIVETTANGSSCVVTPNANGETVFIATLVDADGNAIASDTQTMTSKAGFFQKIIAFFKKIFGLTKIIPEMLK